MSGTIDLSDLPPQGSPMRKLVCFLAAFAALGASGAGAQVLPHHAEYALRLGLAPDAPRIGTAVEDLSQDCNGWHLKRDINTEIPITQSWKLSLLSKLDGEEQRGGNELRFRTVQSQNGVDHELRGRVRRTPKEVHADIDFPSGPQQLVLPPPTLMPIASLNHVIERLRDRAASFPVMTFDAEVIGDAFLVNVEELDPGVLRDGRPGERAIAVPGRSWPVFMTFTRGRDQQQQPLFTLKAKLFDTGVLDHLTVDTGLVTVTADLTALEMRKPPACPRS
jgi:envelope integrity protein B